MAVDLGVFQRQKSLLDVQQEFDARKQAQALQGLQLQAALAQAGNGGLTAKDLLGFQIQQQNHTDSVDLRREGMAQTAALAGMNINARREDYDMKRQDKLEMAMKQDQNALTGAFTGIDQQIADLDQLIGQAKVGPDGKPVYQPMSGLGGNFGLASYVPNRNGSKASDAYAIIDKIKAGTFLEGLNNLKSASKTGASGLGSVTEVEGAKVQNARAALQNSQSEQQFIENAAKYREQLRLSKQNLYSGFNNIYGGLGAAPQQNADPLGLRKK